MKVGSLFSGIGGLELGLERAGMNVRWQVEWDDYCNQVLAKHWPDIPRYKDIHDVDPAQLEPVDLICGGFPCQPVSLAGARKAQDDDRWLWPEFFRIVRHLRPRYVLVENVPGLASAGMGDVLGDLASIGYDCEWESIPAAAVGAPHLRYRIFIVAYPTGTRPQGRWDTGSDGTRTETPDSVETDGPLGCVGSDRALADTLGAGPQRGGSGRSPGTQETTGQTNQLERPSWWGVEPDVGRVANGIPNRVDRLRGLGNAVVPQVAEWVGRRIMEHAHE
jgi:DNA (cytosine-5)-methyltransferase 1